MTDMRVAAVGVHVLDTHVIGVESIPAGSDGQLVDTIRMSPAGTAGGTAVVLSRLGAEVVSVGAVGTDPIADVLLALLAREGVNVSGLVRKADQQTSASVLPVRPNGDRPAWHCIGANGAFTLDDLAPGALEGITHLHLGGPEFLGGEVTRTCWRGSRPPSRTPTTCCPTTSRCWGSPAPARSPTGRVRWSTRASGASR